MSLGVTIIDKVHQKVLNEGGKKYGILIDDSISDIKTKIFVNTDDFYKETIMYYPNLVRLQIDDSKIMDNSNLSLNYSSIPKKPIVYVTSIFDIIVEKQKYYDFDLEPYKLYMDFKNDNDVIYELYEKLSEELNIPIIASGGAGNVQHFIDTFKIGKADAALAASVFHKNLININDLKKCLKKELINIRK